MKMDKKQLTQIVLLAVLVAAGVGVYMMQQDDGLDLGFITGLFGDKPPPKAPPPAAKQAPVKPPAPPAAAARPAAVPAIPAEPVKGQLRGQAFAVEGAVLENAVLSLRQGEDAEIRLVLPTPRWETPAGKRFRVMDKPGADAPRVHLVWREGDQLRQRPVSDNFTLVLEFGQEKDRKLPGKIHLAVAEADKSTVAGTFEAEIRGFRIVNGKPDLTSDSVETLEFLALREILKDDPDKPIEVLALRDGRLDAAGAAGKPNGYLEVEYRLGEAKATVQRFQFVKEEGAWKVARALSAGQIEEAHPVLAPGPKDPPARLFPYLAAKRLEADLQKKDAKGGVHGVEFNVRVSERHKIGVCEASYKLEPGGAAQKIAYLFRQKPDGWVLERPLAKSERVNFDSGRIEKR